MVCAFGSKKAIKNQYLCCTQLNAVRQMKYLWLLLSGWMVLSSALWWMEGLSPSPLELPGILNPWGKKGIGEFTELRIIARIVLGHWGCYQKYWSSRVLKVTQHTGLMLHQKSTRLGWQCDSSMSLHYCIEKKKNGITTTQFASTFSFLVHNVSSCILQH